MSQDAGTKVSGSWIEGYSVKGYELLEALGDGAEGRMVKARHTNLGRVVVMKLLKGGPNDAAVETFLDMARQVAKLHHPNVASVVDAGTCPESGLHYVASEFLEGGSLEALLEERGKLPEPEALAIGQAICEALVCLEESGLAHGDLRPANLLFDADGTPKLTELGLTPPPGGVGSVSRGRCLAPECFEGDPPDGRSDQYGLGVTLYRAVVGRYPHSGDTWDEQKAAHTSRDIAPPTGVSPGAAQVIQTLCSRSPNRRYPSAQEANLDMVRVMTGHPPAGATGHFGSQTAAIQLPDGDASGPDYLEEDTDLRTPPLASAVFAFNVRLSSRGVTLKEFEFRQEKVTIGRSGASDIHIDNPIVSRRHAQFSREGGKLYITPLSSTNVTSLGGNALSAQTEVAPGATVVISDKFHLDVSWDPSQAISAPLLGDEEDDKTPVVGSPMIRRQEPATVATAALSDDTPVPTPSVRALSRTPSPPTPSTPAPTAAHRRAPKEEPSPYGSGSYTVEPTLDDDPYAAVTDPAVAQLRPSDIGMGPIQRPSGMGTTSEWELPQGHLVYQRRGRPVRSHVDKGFQVGSSPACDLRLPRGAPRKAALIVRGTDEYRIYNVAPEVRQVTLNGESVPDRAVLEDGDVITVCGVELQFVAG